MMTSILNYIKINDFISTSGQPTKKQFKKIAENDFEVVINLALYNSNNALKNEDKIINKNNMIYIHIPISWDKPEYKSLKLFCSILQTLQKQNKKVFIHCAKNYRVSVFMHYYLKNILNIKKLKFNTPKEYTPNKTWQKILKLKQL